MTATFPDIPQGAWALHGKLRLILVPEDFSVHPALIRVPDFNRATYHIAGAPRQDMPSQRHRLNHACLATVHQPTLVGSHLIVPIGLPELSPGDSTLAHLTTYRGADRLLDPRQPIPFRAFTQVRAFIGPEPPQLLEQFTIYPVPSIRKRA